MVRDHRQLPPNNQLSEARRRLLSPSGSGRPMSRQELAEAVNAYLWKEHRRKVSLDGNYIGKLERGQHRWPGDLYREAFRTVLKAASDADLGFYIIRTLSGVCGGQALAGGHDPGNGGTLDEIPAAVLEGLRSALSVYRPRTESDTPTRTLAAVEAAAGYIHEVYQRADYDTAGGMLPDLIRDVHASVIGSPGYQRQWALRIQAATYIAASKLASKAGDGALAWVTADRAATAAQLAESATLSAAATYQVACALLRFPDKRYYAEELATTTAESLTRPGCNQDADCVSTRGSLLLLAALIAAQRNDRQAARQYLEQGAALAELLGRDDNRVWTAFGPTNVAIHEVSVAVELGDLDRATEFGERLDTSRMPRRLVGRRTQVHLDLAAAYARRRDGDALAVLHLLEAERLAPQSIRVNVVARTLLAGLLRRERRAATPGLRSLAQRAGVAA